MPNIRTDVPLRELSTFRLGGRARSVVSVKSEEDIVSLMSKLPPELEWLVIGGGSNVIFPDSDIEALIIRPEILGIEIVSDDSGGTILRIGAGEEWDEVVSFAASKGLSGIEALSAIPGTAGATPIQNVGAYGTEIKDVLVSLRAFDTQSKQFVELSNKECQFSYRDSVFKNEAKGRYIISSITLKLSRKTPQAPSYPGVSEYFQSCGIKHPSLSDIREAIIAIRKKKLPDPKEIASAGSFFKNPIVKKELADAIKSKFPSVAIFPVTEKTSKVGAGSLIDTLGWKGKKVGNFSFYKGNAMVIVHEGGGTREELQELVAKLNAEIQKTYGLVLESEPEFI